MSRCEKCQNLKPFKKGREQYFWKRIDAQGCAKLAQHPQKIKKLFFYYDLLLQCMEIIWVNFYKTKGFGVKFYHHKCYYVIVYIILGINDVECHSKRFTSILDQC